MHERNLNLCAHTVCVHMHKVLDCADVTFSICGQSLYSATLKRFLRCFISVHILDENKPACKFIKKIYSFAVEYCIYSMVQRRFDACHDMLCAWI